MPIRSIQLHDGSAWFHVGDPRVAGILDRLNLLSVDDLNVGGSADPGKFLASDGSWKAPPRVGGAIDVTAPPYGAVGDDATDDHDAIQAAIDAASDAYDTLGAVLAVDLGARRYRTSATLTAGDNPLVMYGRDKSSSFISALPGLDGYVLKVSGQFALSDFTVTGTGEDGSYGIGGDSGKPANVNVRRVRVYLTEYGFRFAGAFELPAQAHFSEVYVYAARTCGFMAATGGKAGTHFPTSGQSAWTFDNVLITNGGGPSTRQVPAVGLSVTSGGTSDTLEWDGTDATEFGYVIMRRPAYSTDGNSWEHVAYVWNGETTRTVGKASGEDWTYAVVRNSHGMYLRYGKAVDIGSVQTEYMGVGLHLEDVNGVNVGAVYSEWRGNDLNNPTPRGDAVRAANSHGISIATGWVEAAFSAIAVVSVRGMEVGTVRGNNLQRSVVHYVATSENMPITLGPALATGSTPRVLSTDGGAYSANMVGDNLGADDDPAAARKHYVSHTHRAEHVAGWRGNRAAAVGADRDGGYMYVTAPGLPAPTADHAGQVRRNGGEYFTCWNYGSGYEWSRLVRFQTIANEPKPLIEGAREGGFQTATLGYDGQGRLYVNPFNDARDFVLTHGGVQLGWDGPRIRTGTGSPEGVLTAVPGSMYTDKAGGAGATLYVKETGTGNTGWVAK